MAHNKLYRNFIILQEDERGYSHANDKALSGYAKIEAKGDKCKVSFYAQNLKQEDNYSMVLICCKRDLKQLIDIGPLTINEVGKGDTSKEYYVNNIAGLGISYEKVSGAAICRANDNENEFVMHGFMNGEDSTDNWRKFKYIKADSKKYINKVESEPAKKEFISAETKNKVVASQSSVEKLPKLQNESIERKNEEESINKKENIELGNLDNDNSEIEDMQNRIPENHANIAETKDLISEDRKKCKEVKKEEKNDKCTKCDKFVEYDSYEKSEDIEDIINKLNKKLDIYEGVVDIKINHNIHEDVIVYGFIKDKNNYKCKWKKFKLEKKCRVEDEDYSTIQNYKRIEENYKLDKLSEVDNSDRLDLIDFDKYEKDIQIGNMKKNTGNMGQTGMVDMGFGQGTMAQSETENIDTGTPKISKISTEDMGTTGGTQTQPEVETTGTAGGTMNQPQMGAVDTGMPKIITTEIQGMETPPKEKVSPQSFNICGKLDFNNVESYMSDKISQGTGNKFCISGKIGQYFEKIAEGFAPYLGYLTDINHCKWYKINVNSVEDLSDESNYNQYTLAYYPMLNYYPYISKTGHFLLGYKCNRNGEMQYIIYAIPGSKEKNDQPYGGRTGFVTWTSDDKSGRGYWLMFYDFKKSSIVIPTR